MANLIANGTFEVTADPWIGNFGGETVIRDTASPCTGTAHLKIVTPGNDPEEGAFFDVAPIPIAAEIPIRVSIVAKGAGIIAAQLGFAGANTFAYGPEWTLTGECTPFAWDTETPIGTTGLSLTIATPHLGEAQAITFWVDDVIVDDDPPSATPPAAPAIVAALAARARRGWGLRGRNG